jgi:hypothetical protein
MTLPKVTINERGFPRIEVPIIVPEHGVDKWEIIDKMIRDYVKLHPEEMKTFLNDVRNRRASLKRDTGSSDTKSMRLSVSMPSDLYMRISEFFPEVFQSNENVSNFMRRFQGFTIPKNV